MIGVVIVKDKRILATGYVGSPVGMPHCDEAGHQMKKVTHEDGSETQHCMRTSHAEINAICNAARYGIAIDGATIYGKFEPCYTCAKAIINAGIKRVVCEKQYHAASDTRELFKLAKIDFVVHLQEVEKYDNQ
jgi:dCMP deaminase